MRSTSGARSSGMLPPASVTQRRTEFGRALAYLPAVQVHPAHPRLGRERDQLGTGQVRRGQRVATLGQLDDRAALGRLVGQAGAQRRGGQLGLGYPGHRDELRRHPVPVGDGAGLVEQEGGGVAGGLDGPSRHGQHVPLHHPVHAGDADGQQQPADRGRREADEQRDQDGRGLDGLVVDRHRLQRDDRDQQDQRQPGDQDVERDLVRVFRLPPRPGRSCGPGRSRRGWR